MLVGLSCLLFLCCFLLERSDARRLTHAVFRLNEEHDDVRQRNILSAVRPSGLLPLVLPFLPLPPPHSGLLTGSCTSSAWPQISPKMQSGWMMVVMEKNKKQKRTEFKAKTREMLFKHTDAAVESDSRVAEVGSAL